MRRNRPLRIAEAISSPAFAGPVTLADVGATMAQWLGVPPPDRRGRPIAALLV